MPCLVTAKERKRKLLKQTETKEWSTLEVKTSHRIFCQHYEPLCPYQENVSSLSKTRLIIRPFFLCPPLKRTQFIPKSSEIVFRQNGHLAPFIPQALLVGQFPFFKIIKSSIFWMVSFQNHGILKGLWMRFHHQDEMMG